MSEFTEAAGPPVSGDVYAQNRKLVGLLRETIGKLDMLVSHTEYIQNADILNLSNWLEAEVSIIVT